MYDIYKYLCGVRKLVCNCVAASILHNIDIIIFLYLWVPKKDEESCRVNLEYIITYGFVSISSFLPRIGELDSAPLFSDDDIYDMYVYSLTDMIT